MSRGDIGNYLGLAEETICRLFSRLQQQGLITVKRRQVELNDLGRLRALATRAALPAARGSKSQIERVPIRTAV
jgi:CRP/FNR family transcriptional regulator